MKKDVAVLLDDNAQLFFHPSMEILTGVRADVHEKGVSDHQPAPAPVCREVSRTRVSAQHARPPSVDKTCY
jgi:hypothetical protein